MSGGNSRRAAVWKNVVQHVTSGNKVLETQHMWEERRRDSRLQKKIDEIDYRHAVALTKRHEQLSAEVGDLKSQLPHDVYYSLPLSAFNVQSEGGQQTSLLRNNSRLSKRRRRKSITTTSNNDDVRSKLENRGRSKRDEQSSRRKRQQSSSITSSSSSLTSGRKSSRRPRLSEDHQSPRTSSVSTCTAHQHDDHTGSGRRRVKKRNHDKSSCDSDYRSSSKKRRTITATDNRRMSHNIRSDDARDGFRFIERRSSNQWEAARIKNAALKAVTMMKPQDSNLKRTWKSDFFGDTMANNKNDSLDQEKQRKSVSRKQRASSVKHSSSDSSSRSTTSSQSTSRSTSSSQSTSRSTSSSAPRRSGSPPPTPQRRTSKRRLSRKHKKPKL